MLAKDWSNRDTNPQVPGQEQHTRHCTSCHQCPAERDQTQQPDENCPHAKHVLQPKPAWREMPPIPDRAVWGKWEPYMHSGSNYSTRFSCSSSEDTTWGKPDWTRSRTNCLAPSSVSLEQGRSWITVHPRESSTGAHSRTHTQTSRRKMFDVHRKTDSCTFVSLSSWETWCFTTSKKNPKKPKKHMLLIGLQKY